jgi:GMP synthase (glutamine-hydrolysing)
VRELEVYSEVLEPEISATKLRELKGLRGIILSGGARSVFAEDAPRCDVHILELGVPLLGICYGHQLLAQQLGGKVIVADVGEYGTAALRKLKPSPILEGLDAVETVWMNHRDIVVELPPACEPTAATDASPIAAFEDRTRNIYGVQFHPEVTHTPCGLQVLKNFVFGVCKARRSWTSKSFIETAVQEAREKIGDKKAVIGLSGGVDSSTAAVLVSKAIGKNLTAVYVDTGLMRAGEREYVESVFSGFDLKLRIVDAAAKFFEGLKGVTQPERKRKIIGKLFIEIFESACPQQLGWSFMSRCVTFTKMKCGKWRGHLGFHRRL